MRGRPSNQGAMFSYVSLEERLPKSHPLRKLRLVVDPILTAMYGEFDAVYARTGRPSAPPERLLKSMLLQILFTIRSERLLVESIDYNLLYRWFVGLAIDDPVWDHSARPGCKAVPQIGRHGLPAAPHEPSADGESRRPGVGRGHDRNRVQRHAAVARG